VSLFRPFSGRRAETRPHLGCSSFSLFSAVNAVPRQERSFADLLSIQQVRREERKFLGSTL
jgi:hypothetical protein